MKFGVLGTGRVGKAIGAKLVELGHHVTMGSRTADNAEASRWAQSTGGDHGAFADAAAAGEVVVNATSGMASLAVLASAGASNLAGKVLIDVANPLDGSAGFPPALSVCNTDSLGEQIQRTYPDARVVKTLNTMNAVIMVDPKEVPGSHNVFVCGDDATAKATVAEILGSFGWPRDDIIDLGGIRAARGCEMVLPLWIELMRTIGSPQFNFHIARST
jgi:8-hydroxy-5-deazaflavin:NADPH oxidoreductase